MDVTLPASHLAGVLDVAAGARQLQPTEDSVKEFLALVAALVPCEQFYWNRTQTVPRRRLLVEIGEPNQDDVPISDEFCAEWERHRPEHPIMSGSQGPVIATSDVYPSTFHDTWLYNECFRPRGLEHEIGVHLSHPPDELHVVCLSRGPGRAFDDRDHIVLRLLRPHLDTAFNRTATNTPRLTRREVEVLRLVRAGLTNKQIAHRLGVQETTVAKHLEHVYARTGAQSRVQALDLCRSVLD